MNVQWVGGAPTSNYASGRQGREVEIIVQHWMAGTIEAALARFMNPTAIVSAHYLVGQERGEILQLVQEEDTAFHAGDWNFNIRSIGIEAEAGPDIPPTPELYANLAELYRDIADRHGIVLGAMSTVIPHRMIVATQCPGTIDIQSIIEDATGENDVAQTPQELWDNGLAEIVQQKVVAPFTDDITAIKAELAKLSSGGTMSNAELATLVTKLGVILEKAGADIASKP